MRVNYSHEGAAWGAIFALESIGGSAAGSSILCVRDNFGTSTTGLPPVTSFNDIQNNIEYPKAIYDAFKMLTMMPGTRKAVTLPTTLRLHRDEPHESRSVCCER